MASVLSGKITYANGMAAPGVTVRVFDQDAPGKGDDDLTLTPGLSDAGGWFTVEYDPGRYLDFINLPFLGLRRSASGGGGLQINDPLDILSPYLQFSYTFNDEACTQHMPVVPFQTQYELPEAPRPHFVPSQHGFHFVNNFRGFALPFTVPFLPDLTKVGGSYGLCGGMSAAASDYFLTGRAIPQTTEIPVAGSKLYKYLFRRAMDSFAAGELVLRFARWMVLPDDGPNGLTSLSRPELEKLTAALDQGRLAPIGLVIASAKSANQIVAGLSLNHQVLAYGYTAHPDGAVDIRVYDPNSPGRDDAYLHTTPLSASDGSPAGIQCRAVGINVGTDKIRGFFVMPYQPAEPPVIL